MTRLALAFAGFFVVWSQGGVAWAQEVARRLSSPVDAWSEPNPGVRYLLRTYDEPTVVLHALVVDLSQASVVATAEQERWSTVSDFASRHHAAAAVNGGFWGMWQRPRGVAAGQGALWDRGAPDAEFGYFAVLRDRTARVMAPGEGEDDASLARVSEAVSGRPILVEAGEVALEVLDAFESANQRQPRTAVGVSRDGRRAILVVADGRQTHSRGLTLYQLARTLRELGAWRALNLDGGGSSTMYVERVGGIVNSPARGRWQRWMGESDAAPSLRTRRRRGEPEVYVRGVEREVMNHLAVIAAPPPDEISVQAAGEVLLDGLPPSRRTATFAPSEDAPIRTRQLREIWIPFLYLSVPAVGLGSVWRLARRRISFAREARRARSARARRPVHSNHT